MLAVRTASCSSMRCRAVSQSFFHLDEVVSLGESSRPRRTPSHRSFTSCPPIQAQKTGGPAGPAGQARRKKIRAAQSFAQGLKNADFVGTKLNPTEKTKKEEIEGTKDKTADEQIQDILGKPPTPPWKQRSSWWGENPKELEREEKRYRKLYKTAHAAVDSAFVLAQLRVISEKCGLSKTGPKVILIQNLMSHFQWEVPGAKSKQQAEPAVEAPPTSSITLDLPPHELFLFLRDRRLLEDLIFQQGVKLSTVSAASPSSISQTSEDRLILQAEGTEAALTRLQLILNNRATYMKKLDVSNEDLEGIAPSQGVINFVSHSTGAFIGREDSGFNIYSMDERKTTLAKHMLQSAVFNSHRLSSRRSLSVITPPTYDKNESSDLYSVLPFFPSPSSLIPWQTLKNTHLELTYRLSKNKAWHASHTSKSSRHRTEDMANSKVHVVGQEGIATTLRNLFKNTASSLDGERERTHRITFGHMLFRHDTSVPAGHLSSPIPGRWPASDTLTRIQHAQRPIFAPGLAPAAVHTPLTSTVPRYTQHSRRLTYRSPDGSQQAVFTHTWPASPAPGSVPQTKTPNSETENWLAGLQEQISALEKAEDNAESNSEDLIFEKDDDAALGAEENESEETVAAESRALTEPEASQSSEIGEAAAADSPGAEVSSMAESGEIVAELSTLTEADLLMPDRPIDARLTVSENIKIDPSSIPEDIRTFFGILLAPVGSGKPVKPSAPLEVILDDTRFVLENDEDLRTTWSSNQSSPVVLKTVKVADKLIQSSRSTSHSEVIGEEIPDEFWSEWANTAREIDPAFAGSDIETNSRFTY